MHIEQGSKSSGWRELFTLLDFRSFFKILRIVGKSLPHRVGAFSMLPNPSKCHIRPKINKKITYFNNKIKNPLELRLDAYWTTHMQTANKYPTQYHQGLSPGPGSWLGRVRGWDPWVGRWGFLSKRVHANIKNQIMGKIQCPRCNTRLSYQCSKVLHWHKLPFLSEDLKLASC
jgi:hypothetical protein